MSADRHFQRRDDGEMVARVPASELREGDMVDLDGCPYLIANPTCLGCDEEIAEDGEGNWTHTSDGARFCQRPEPEDEDGATLAAPDRTLEMIAECELFTVDGGERETVDCYRVDFEGASIGFPPDYVVTVVKR